MKKLLTGILILMVVALTACSASPSETVQPTQASVATEAATTAAAADGALNTNYDNAVSVEQQLLLGVLNLDGTDQQIGKEQAASLVSLLTNLQSLSMQNMPTQIADGTQTDTSTQQPPAQNNDNQAQIEVLLQQIEAVMTADQLKAISAMQITRDSAASIMEAKGITANFQGGTGAPQGGTGAPQGGTGAPQGNGDANGAPMQGDGSAPQGTPPAMNGTPDASGQGQPGQGQPGGNGRMGGGMIQPELLSAVIQYVANIAGVEVPTAVPGQ